MRRENDDTPREPGDDGTTPPAVEDDVAGKADRNHLRELQRQRQGRVVRVIIALAILGVLIVFIVSNSQEVDVDFVFFTRRPALIWVMFTCAILGGVVGYLIGRPGKQIRLHRSRKEDERK